MKTTILKSKHPRFSREREVFICDEDGSAWYGYIAELPKSPRLTWLKDAWEVVS